MVKNRRIALSVVMTAFSYGLNITGISPILGILNERYAEYGTATVRLLQTMPYLLVMVGALAVGKLTTKFAKKKIIMTGLLIIGICGTIPFFIDNFAVLFVMRTIIGFGFGIVGPMNTAIIAEFIEPEERASYMGLHVVGMGIGTMAGNLIGGTFAGAGYQFFYLIYVMAFFSLIGIKIFLVETPPVEKEKKEQMKLNGKVYVIAACSFVHTLFINIYSTNISIYIYESVNSHSALSGVATGINAAAALIMGMIFGKVSGKLGRGTLPFSVLIAGIGYGCLLFIPGMTGVCLASICCGLSLSCFMAMCSYLISISVRKEAVAKASGVFSIVGGIGGLIAPVILGNVSTAVFGRDTAVSQFRIGFAGFIIFGIILLGIVRFDRNNMTE